MTIFDVVRQYPRRWKRIAECRQIVEDFAERLNAARKRLKQSHRQFAIANGITPSRIHNLCNGQTLPRLDELEILSPMLSGTFEEVAQ